MQSNDDQPRREGARRLSRALAAAFVATLALGLVLVAWTYSGTADGDPNSGSVPGPESSDSSLISDESPSSPTDAKRSQVEPESIESGPTLSAPKHSGVASVPDPKRTAYLDLAVEPAILVTRSLSVTVALQRLSASHGPIISAKLAGGPNEYRLDITEFLEALRYGEADLVVSASDGDLLTGRVIVPASSMTMRAANAELEEFGVSARIQLTPCGLMIGRVVSEAGDPLAGVTVALAADSLGRPRRRIMDSVLTGADGRFSFSIRQSFESRVLILAEEAYYPNQTYALAPGMVVDVGVIVVPGGAEISGVVVGASTEIPVDKMLLTAFARSDGETIQVGARAILWGEGPPRVYARSTRTDSRGNFRFAGLNRDAYVIITNGPPSACSTPGVPGRSISVTAPDSGVRFELQAPVVGFEIVGDAATQSPTVLVVDGDWSGECNTNEAGRAYWLVKPATRISAYFRCQGYKPGSIDLVSPDLGEYRSVRFELEPLDASSGVLVQLEGVEKYPIREASFAITQVDSDSTTHAVTKHISQYSPDGQYRLDGFDVGRYAIRIQAGTVPRDGRFYCPASIDVSVGTADVDVGTVELQKGGRLRLRIVDASGANIPAKCTLLSGTGIPLSVRFVAVDGVGGKYYESEDSLHPIGSDPTSWAEVSSAICLPFVDARVEATGYRVRTERIQIEVGVVVDRQVVMEPE